MEPYEYQTLFEFENYYWWYRHLHSVIYDSLIKLGANHESRIIDVGCGTGKNIHILREKITKHVYGFDFSKYAAHFWKKRDITKNCIASINQIPFEAEQFDYVICADVLESEGIDEKFAIAEMLRVAKAGAYLVLIVPAHDWLMTPEHHKAVHAIRRYTYKRLVSLLGESQSQVRRITYLYTSIFPGVVVYRSILRFLTRNSTSQPRSELQPIHPIINKFLISIVDIERRVLHSINLPFGSSILAIVQKIS